MRKFLTNKMSCFFWLLVGLLSVANTASAQEYYLVIADGDSAGVEMRIGIANYRDFCLEGIPQGPFSTQIVNPILAGDPADVGALIDLDPITADVGIAERGGGIAFDTKAMNVQNAGAIGMLLINNDQVNPNNTINYGTVGAVTDFWGISVSYNNGLIIKALAPFTFNIIAKQVPDTDIVLWGGEGEFDGGLEEWTTVGLACGDAGQDPQVAIWKWAADGYTEGLYGGAKIASPTVCNGAVYFNSDLYDTGGLGGASGAGDCLANQNGELISPPIDLSAYPEETALTLKFTQMTRQYQSGYFVGWSNDGGATWTEIEINGNIVLNSGYENSTQRIKLIGATPSADFRVKFRYDGNYYFWIIDDVKIIEPEDFNATIDPNWMATAPYPTMPLSQAVPVQFMTDVHNIGGKELTNVNLKATIFDEANTEVYSATAVMTSPGATAGTVFSGDTIQNTIWGSYTPTETGDYRIVYEVTSDQVDFDETNNKGEKTFTVTQAKTGEWGRENGVTGSIALLFTDPARVDWMYSNIFRGEKAGDFVKEVRFGVANANEVGAVGGQAQFFIYEVTDDGDYNFTDAEHDIVGYNFYEFQAGDPAALVVTLPILDFTGGTDTVQSIEIKEGKFYVLGMVYQAPESSPSTDLRWQTGNAVNQRVSEFITEAQGLFVPTHTVSTPWETDGTIDATSARSVFAGTPVPFARFSLGTLSNNNLILAENTYKVFPTNTRDNISVDFNFDNATNATMEVFDVKGNRVYTNKLENQKDQIEVINVGNFAQGTYFVRVTTPNGSLSKPFNVIK